MCQYLYQYCTDIDVNNGQKMIRPIGLYFKAFCLNSTAFKVVHLSLTDTSTLFYYLRAMMDPNNYLCSELLELGGITGHKLTILQY